MTTREKICTTFPRIFPLRLQAIDSDPLPWRPAVLAALLLATLIPRVWATCHWDVLWGDTLHYVYASEAMRHGNTHEALAEFGLNVYPVILLGLRQLSPDWETTGKWWSVLMATLTVFPLWGWLRRMFSDRVAAAACFCYAFHGKLIAISPLMIRDATFIFFAATTLYLLWRAASEARLSYFLLAGIVLTLAVHTRTEGWLLCVPVVGWPAVRAWNVRQGRWHAIMGTILCLGCIPGAIAVVNLVWLRDEPHWEILRPGHVQILDQIVAQWRRSSTTTAPESPQATLPSPIAIPTAQPLPVSSNVLPPRPFNAKTLNFKFLERFAKALTWPGGALLLLGLLTSWRQFMRPEHLVLSLMNMLLLVLIRLRYAQAGLDIRYFLLIAYIALPWMGLGCLQLIAWIGALTERGRASTPLKKLLVITLVGVVAASLSMIDGPLGAEHLMRRHADIGRWILTNFGSDAAVTGNFDATSLTVHYAQCRMVETVTWNDFLHGSLPHSIADRQATVVVLWRDESVADAVPNIVAQRIVADHAYRYIEPRDLPLDPKEAKEMIFVRVGP